MLIVRGTRKFLDRVGGVTATEGDRSTTALGDWYATVLFWKPQVALFVNGSTLLPVVMPFAPAATVLERFPDAQTQILTAHRVGPAFIAREQTASASHRTAKTSNRSVVGVMNGFAHLATLYQADDVHDHVTLSLMLAQVPCGPLFDRHVSPDRELAAIVSDFTS